MKVLSYKREPGLEYANEERLEGFDASKHWKHLGDYNGREYFSFDPEFVKLADQDEAIEFKVHDGKDDVDFLNSLQNKLPYLQQELQDIKAKMFRELDLFDILTGIAAKDKYVIGKLDELKKEHDEYLKKLGF